MFLFHTGSIKSNQVSKEIDHVVDSFYSILVRLKVDNWVWLQYGKKCFYSILVRLKVCARIYVHRLALFVSIPYWFD